MTSELWVTRPKRWKFFQSKNFLYSNFSQIIWYGVFSYYCKTGHNFMSFWGQNTYKKAEKPISTTQIKFIITVFYQNQIRLWSESWQNSDFKSLFENLKIILKFEKFLNSKKNPNFWTKKFEKMELLYM